MSTSIIARAFVLLALSVALAVMVSVAAATQARAEGYTPSAGTPHQGVQCEDGVINPFSPADDGYYAFDEDGMHLDPTDERYKAQYLSADPCGHNAFEISEQGSSEPSLLTTSFSSEDTVSEQDNPAGNGDPPGSESEQGCFTVDVSDTEQVSQQEVAALQLLGFYSFADGAEQLYAPQCADGEYIEAFPEATQTFIRSSECFDVISATQDLSDATVEYIGCPEQDSVDDEAYTPITQQGTYAPSDWRSHVVPLKRASSDKPATTASKPSSPKEATTSTPVKTVPYIEHRDGDNGRSQGQVVERSSAIKPMLRQLRFRASSRRKRRPRRLPTRGGK